MSKKALIKIRKNFGITISSAYQSYNFGSVMEMTLPKEIDLHNKDDKEYTSRCNTWLSTNVIEDTISDVKAFAGDNAKFRTILADRNTKIETLSKKFSELDGINISNMEV